MTTDRDGRQVFRVAPVASGIPYLPPHEIAGKYATSVPFWNEQQLLLHQQLQHACQL